MTPTPSYEQIISNSLQGLPDSALAEIADFVSAVRKRVLSPEELEDELWEAGVRAELKKLSRDWEAHMEEEAASNE